MMPNSKLNFFNECQCKPVAVVLLKGEVNPVKRGPESIQHVISQNSFFKESYGSFDCSNKISNEAHMRFGALNIGEIIVDNKPHFLWKHNTDIIGQ